MIATAPPADLLGRMQAALLRSTTTTLHPGDLTHRSRHLTLAALADQVALAERDGVVRGWCWTMSSGEVDLFRVDDDPTTMAALWSALERSRGPLRGMLVDPQDTAVVEGLRERGWTRGDTGPVLRHADPGAVPPPRLPDGVRIASMADPGVERASRIATHREVFPKGELDEEQFARLQSRWPYDPATDVVVVDDAGQVHAFATGWFAPGSRVGAVEPVGVAEASRGRGFGSAVSAAVTRALAAAGATEVWVATSGEIATRTYRGVGFDPWREESWWSAPSTAVSDAS